MAVFEFFTEMVAPGTGFLDAESATLPLIALTWAEREKQDSAIVIKHDSSSLIGLNCLIHGLFAAKL